MSEADAPRGLFARLKNSLARTRTRLGDGVADLVLGRARIDSATLEELEELLLSADVGLPATEQLISGVEERLRRSELKDGSAVVAGLRQEMLDLLVTCEQPLPAITGQPHLILMVGVNGAGKTTTIGKLARRLRGEGHSVLLAAGDTFRAAAVEQLRVWGERNEVPVIHQHAGADAAAVIYDALEAARSRGTDVVLADTSGRLHSQSHLMAELAKVRRVVQRFDADAPHQTLLVLDAGNGQNALQQVREFHQAAGVDGVVLTKLDGTARGGVVLAVARELQLPIRYIGLGEGIDDLRPFEAQAFVDALLSQS